eukprot:TRINITY_DN35904_c0_g1_i1.p1 TRINITY_DN35904_c0_g1~~TRINITY_DN35904_c0_g1_i1.p1  ORF type:complete len:415 (+),score=62.91 TRINITY_DN35904_c0_g1_i1:13-1257(+)
MENQITLYIMNMNLVFLFLFVFQGGLFFQLIPSSECSQEFSPCKDNSDCCEGNICDLNTCYTPFIPFQSCETVTMAFAGMNPIDPGECEDIAQGTLTFWKMLRDVGLFPILNQVTWTGTALGPNNLAFTNFVAKFQNSLTFAQIKQAVLYHIIPDVVISPSNATDGMILKTGLSFSPDINILCDDDSENRGDLTIQNLDDRIGVISTNTNLQIISNGSTANAQFGYHQPCFASTFILDEVLIPCFPFKCNSIFDMISDRLPQFAQFLQQTGVFGALGGRDWRGTVLAPPGEALSAAQPILNNLNESQILQIVQYHIIPDFVLMKEDLLQENGSDFFDTAACEKSDENCVYVLRFDGANGTVSVEGIQNSVNIVSFDVVGCDSVLHYIDGLLLPFEVVQSLSGDLDEAEILSQYP